MPVHKLNRNESFLKDDWPFSRLRANRKRMTRQAAGRPVNRPGRPVYFKRDARDEDGAALCVLYSLRRCPDIDKPACHWQGRRLVHKVMTEKVLLVA